MLSRLLLLLFLGLGVCLAQTADSYVHQPGSRLSLAELTALCEDRSLKRLDLRGGGLRDGDVVPLAKATWLEELHLDSHTLTPTGYAVLKDLKNLKVLGVQSLSSPEEIETVFELIKDFPLEELNLSNSSVLSGEGLAKLNCHKTLKVLDLSCSRGGLTDEGLAGLAGFTELRSLDLNGHGALKMGLEPLSGLTKLETLNVYGCHGLLDEAFIAIFKNLKNLKDLNMGFCWWHKGEGLVFPASVENLYLVESKQLTDAAFEKFPCRDNVVHVNLFQCLPMTDRGIIALGRMPKLETLNVGCIRALTDASLRSIGRNVTLRELNVSDNDSFTDEGMISLKGLRKLEVLNFWHLKGLTGSGLEIIPGLPNLRELNLADCHNLRDDGLDHVIVSKSIEALYLDNGKTITDEGIARLVGMSTLKELTLQGCANLTDESLRSVSKLRGLEYLDISNCLQMTDEGRRKIQKALPNCTIVL
ncbi:MAG: Leucine-rich repeat (LRR) protein [Akkermansiaceae bacterium]|jgi:F-box/leucine-rich repeat protein 14